MSKLRYNGNASGHRQQGKPRFDDDYEDDLDMQRQRDQKKRDLELREARRRGELDERKEKESYLPD